MRFRGGCRGPLASNRETALWKSARSMARGELGDATPLGNAVSEHLRAVSGHRCCATREARQHGRHRATDHGHRTDHCRDCRWARYRCGGFAVGRRRRRIPHPPLILLFGVDVKLAGSLSLAISLPTMLTGFALQPRQEFRRRAPGLAVRTLHGGRLVDRNLLWCPAARSGSGRGSAADACRDTRGVGDQGMDACSGAASGSRDAVNALPVSLHVSPRNRNIFWIIPVTRHRRWIASPVLGWPRLFTCPGNKEHRQSHRWARI